MVTSGLLHGKCTLNKQLLDCNQEMKNTKVEMCHVLWSFYGSNQKKQNKKRQVIKFCKISIEILTLGLFEPFYKKEKNHYSNTTVKSWKIKPQELSLGHYFTHCLHRLRCVTLNIINTFFHFCLSLSLKVNLAPFQSSVFQVVSLGFCQICWIFHLEPFVEFCLVWDWKSAEKEEM